MRITRHRDGTLSLRVSVSEADDIYQALSGAHSKAIKTEYEWRYLELIQDMDNHWQNRTPATPAPDHYDDNVDCPVCGSRIYRGADRCGSCGRLRQDMPRKSPVPCPGGQSHRVHTATDRLLKCVTCGRTWSWGETGDRMPAHDRADR